VSTMNQSTSGRGFVEQIEEPPVTRALFGGTRWAWIWLILRLYVGYEWLSAGYGKITNPAWTGATAGSALGGYIKNAITLASGAHPAVQSWYADFMQTVILPNATAWGYVVAFGETLVGVGLILGVFTGIAAFFGGFMNWNYLMAGSVSINPVLLPLEVLLLLAWRTAGWWGVDRWLLPSMGTPWRPGRVFREEAATSAAEAIPPSD
jgi:thiosulfate dehydrogenase [quinone] large subunit